MATSSIPTARGRKLAAELLALRKAAGLSTYRVAELLGWNQSTVSRIETGRTQAKPSNVQRMVELYGAPDILRNELMQIARDAGKRGWWQQGEFEGAFSSALVSLEDAATKLMVWQPQVFPGLLQTEAYARAVIGSGRPDDIERRVRGRMIRKTLLSREEKPPIFHAIIDEAVLRRPVGGVDVMKEQLHSLIVASNRPNVTLQVLPFSAGTHAGLDGMHILLEFEESDPDIGYTEGVAGGVVLESADRVARLRVAFENIQEAALAPAGSTELIAAMARG